MNRILSLGTHQLRSQDEPIVFNTSIRDNIRLGHPFASTDEEVERAAHPTPKLSNGIIRLQANRDERPWIDNDLLLVFVQNCSFFI